MKKIYLAILLTCYFVSLSAEEITEETRPKRDGEIKFSNTIFVEHFSDFLDNEVRTEHKTLMDDPSFNLNEKFQIYFVIPTSAEETGLLNLGCISIPPSAYFSANFIYTHHENFAVRAGVGAEFGFGDYKNPFISGGFGITYLNDMVFKYSEYSDLNLFFNIGHRDSMHFFFDFSGPLNDAGREAPYRMFWDMDITLGYKKALPLFLRINLFMTRNETEINKDTNLMYSYYHERDFVHLQYYGNYYGLSVGYIFNKEGYDKSIYEVNTNRFIDYNQIGYRKSQGGGFTFYVKNSDSTFEVFGEFHLLTDNNFNWMTISKIGVRGYF